MRVDHKTLQERFNLIPVKQEYKVFSFTLDRSKPNANGDLFPKGVWDLIGRGIHTTFPKEPK